MNLISIFHFAAFITYALLIIYVLKKQAASRQNRLCVLLISSWAVFSLSMGLLNVIASPLDIMALVNLAALSLCIQPVFALWFYLSVTDNEHVLKNRFLVAGSVILPVLFLFFQWSGYLASGITNEVWGTGLKYDYSPYVYLYIFYLGAVLLACGLLLVRMAVKAEAPERRKQALVLLVTGAIPAFAVGILALARRLFNADYLPQAVDILMLIWVIGLVFAVSRYGLMRITPVLASENILSTMSDSLLLLNADGRIVYANNATCSLLGTSRDSIEGRMFTSLAGEGSGVARLLNTQNGGKAGPLELDYTTESGTGIPVLASSSVIKETTGKVAGFVVSATDLRQHKIAEAKLAADQTLIKGIVETMPSSVLVLNRELEIILANQQFSQAIGTERDDLKGRLLIDVIPSEEFVAQVASAALFPAGNVQFEFRFGQGCESRVLVASIFSMPSDNTLLILNDVTAERERQDRLYLTDRLASIGEMAAGVAHELNNPLTSVIGLSQMLTEQDVPAEIAQDLNTIYTEALRASNVVRNMLAFARKRPAVRQPVQIHRIADDVLQLRAYEHRVSNITVTRAYAENLPEVVVDYNQMQQVFVNIVLNAEYEMVQANRGGTLTVATAKSGDNVSISFSDNGPGIAPENLKHVFDPFYTTKEVGKGTGLGLSVCYGIVANHGGRIYAEPNQDRGVTFFVELPAAYPSAEPALQAEISDFLKKKGASTNNAAPWLSAGEKIYDRKR